MRVHSPILVRATKRRFPSRFFLSRLIPSRSTENVQLHTKPEDRQTARCFDDVAKDLRQSVCGCARDAQHTSCRQPQHRRGATGILLAIPLRVRRCVHSSKSHVIQTHEDPSRRRSPLLQSNAQLILEGNHLGLGSSVGLPRNDR